MRSLLDDTTWLKAQTARKYQKAFGRVSGIFLAIALIALFDGLLASMRAGSNELDLLAGGSISLSGPAALKNPVSSDLSARFTPVSAPLTFELDGFYAGYWMGNGMWRGTIAASPDAAPGKYKMRVTFRGASAQTAQNYQINVYANALAMREGSLSFFRRWLDVNSFIVAPICGAIGVLFGLITYYFGRKYTLFLLQLGLAQIYRSTADGAIWCMAKAEMAPRSGNSRMVLDETGALLGEARAEEWSRNKLRLKMLGERSVPPGALVCLVPPDVSRNAHMQEAGKQSKS